MVFVMRDENNKIVGYSRKPVNGQVQYEIEDDDPEFIEFLNPDTSAETLRLNEIFSEKEAAGFKQITIQQANDKIDQIFESVSTISQMKDATILVLKKIVPYIIL